MLLLMLSYILYKNFNNSFYFFIDKINLKNNNSIIHNNLKITKKYYHLITIKISIISC